MIHKDLESLDSPLVISTNINFPFSRETTPLFEITQLGNRTRADLHICEYSDSSERVYNERTVLSVPLVLIYHHLQGLIYLLGAYLSKNAVNHVSGDRSSIFNHAVVSGAVRNFDAVTR